MDLYGFAEGGSERGERRQRQRTEEGVGEGGIQTTERHGEQCIPKKTPEKVYENGGVAGAMAMASAERERNQVSARDRHIGESKRKKTR